MSGNVDAAVLSALNNLAERLTDVTDRLEKLETSGPSVAPTRSAAGAPSSAPAAGGSGGNLSVLGWEAIVSTELKAFMSTVALVGGDAVEAANAAVKAFHECGKLVAMAAECAKPADLQSALAPLSNAIGVVTAIPKPRNRKDPQFLCIDLIQGAIGSLCWVAADPNETTICVENNLEIMRFTGDKILMTYRHKEGGDMYVKFENAYTAIWKKVLEYVGQHHQLGLSWNEAGISTSQYKPSTASASTPAPAPASNKTAAAPAPAPKPAPKKPVARPKRPEVNERAGFDLLKLGYCSGTRQQKQNRTIKVENEKKDAIQIYDCEYTNIEIIGTPKAVMVTGCNKYSISLPGCLSQFNVDNSKAGQIELYGAVPTMQVEKCQDFDVYIKSKDAESCQFVSANVTGFNIYLEKEGPEGLELVSLGVPTQFESSLSFRDNTPTLTTTTVEHAGE
eukprot:TRINITY_DN15835_c0_g1_i2.p1 TRINITY_DN15835_c0_g1~~TRINITY_DN15835_c0_g1_i2.p1  ORF type:complete len:450 (-),score=128.80 TRINITY_DN15835_c0_g1_i2:428-1777(-)